MIKYFENLLKTIDKSIHSLDSEKFEQLVTETVDAIDAGCRVIVSGLGKNVPVCEKFVGTMNSLGQPASYMNTNSALHGDIGMADEGDLVIVLTKSGETAESIQLTKLLKQRGCNIWLLTFTAQSTLAEEIKKCIILELGHEGDQWDVVPNNSTTVNLMILQGLAIEAAKRRGVTLQDFKKNHPGGHIGEILKDVR